MMMIKTSIALIGFMATGKTTIGKILATTLGDPYRHIEMDLLIEELAGKSIPEIFSLDGEKQFRKLERLICKKISKLDHSVISCGGGVVLDERNVKDLRKNAIIIHLKSNLETIYDRIIKNGINSRPVANKSNFKEEIKRVYNIRNSLYQKAADFEVDTNDLDTKMVIREILEKIMIAQKS
jgi:shikimate kinase